MFGSNGKETVLTKFGQQLGPAVVGLVVVFLLTSCSMGSPRMGEQKGEILASEAPSGPTVADVSSWFGDVDGYDETPLNEAIPSQPIFLDNRGMALESSLDGDTVHATSYARSDQATLSRSEQQGFIASAIQITRPSDAVAQKAVVEQLVKGDIGEADNWSIVSMDQRTVGSHEFFVYDAQGNMADGSVQGTRDYVSVIGSYFVDISTAWLVEPGNFGTDLVPRMTEPELATITAAMESLIVQIK